MRGPRFLRTQRRPLLTVTSPMPTTLKESGPCRRVLSFSIERERIDQAIEAALRNLSKRVSLKGFRPGKVPFEMVRKTHGAEVADDVRQRLMNEALNEAIKEHDLHPVGEPELDLESLKDEAGAPLTFDLTLEVAPDFELGAIEGLEVTVPLPELHDGLIDREVEAFRKQSAEPHDAPEGAVVGEQDVLEATVVYVIDGEELPPRSDRHVLVQHELVDGLRVEGCKTAFLGKQVGDSVEVDATLPEHFEPAEHAGKAATLRLTLDRHRQMIVPELDAELLKRVGCDTEEEFRGKIREQLEVRRTRMRDGEADKALEQQLLEMHEFEIPERLVEKAVERRVHEYAHRLMEEQQLDSETGHAKAEAERGRIAELTRHGLRVSFVLSRIAREKQLGAGREEAEGRIRALAGMQGQDPDQTLAAAYQEGWIQDVMAQLTEEKTRNWLREHATIHEQAVPLPEAAGPA